MVDKRRGGDGAGDTGSPSSAARKCPICDKPATHDARPFCSKRCADVDLHRWLGGQYSVPVVEVDRSARPQAPADED
ncbi:MAG: DNA gyrase inhibitor YacG [Pseudomonadota bacterium]